jgi:sulfite reductase alpha subunit-like flavoprotein
VDVLLGQEFGKMKEAHPDKLRLDYAVGEKMNIPTLMNEHGEELWKRIKEDNTFVYMSGNKDMEEGIESFMSALAAKHGNCVVHSWDCIKLLAPLMSYDMLSSNKFLTPQSIIFC